VQFDLALLEGSLSQYPMLRKFLKKVRLKIPATVSRMHLPITPEMQLLIGDILHNSFTGIYREIFLRSKAVDILICCLEHIASSGKLLRVALRPPDVAKMETIRDYLLQNLQYPCSPDLLADKISMNKSRLAKYFRLYTGKTVYDFQRDERMKKAKALLRDSNLPISEIALAVGYRRLSNFSDAFKMTFGYSPKTARQSSNDLKKDKK
jgi:AraC-like DNA-binding protein